MSDIYKPEGCETLDKLDDSQIRLGIQGPPFSGKTTSTLTFPNPIVVSLDRKVIAHTHRGDVISVPLYDPAFCDKLVKRTALIGPPNRRDAILKWLQGEALKLTKDQTLILDNATEIEQAFHQQYWLEPVYTDQGKIDAFAEWGLKIEFFRDLHTAIKALKCSVIYLTHESPDRDKKGELNGKLRPLMTGQFGDKLAGNYTDWFAMETISKPKTKDQVSKILEWASIDEATLKEWIAYTPPICQTIYLWQTQSDELRMCGSTTLQNCPKYILADYKSFSKYRKQKTTT
jgi:hypothetical protein